MCFRLLLLSSRLWILLGGLFLVGVTGCDKIYDRTCELHSLGFYPFKNQVKLLSSKGYKVTLLEANQLENLPIGSLVAAQFWDDVDKEEGDFDSCVLKVTVYKKERHEKYREIFNKKKKHQPNQNCRESINKMSIDALQTIPRCVILKDNLINSDQ